TTYSSTNRFVANGDVALFDCGGSLATLTLCALPPQATAPVDIAGPPVADTLPNDHSLVAIGNVGGAAVFHVANVNEIWRSDGTAPGTFRLAAGDWVRPASTVHPISIVHNGKLYFVGCRATDDCSLYATDGTVAGTTTVAPLGLTTSIAEAWFERYGTEFVVGIAGFYYGGIWRSDGTTAGTRRIVSGVFERFNMAVVGDRIFFDACCNYPWGLNVSDGTEAGTRAVPLPPDMIGLGSALFENIGDTALILGCSTSTDGTSICAVDREGTGIARVAALGRTGRGASVALLGRTRDAIYVAVDDTLHGREPWRIRVRDAIFSDGFDAQP
ncbi:MAG TPA: hypothetical protein VJ724_00635, partial [Tahibacter sp.]|nr:hypothetical protein [Tahibacter sp.]